MQSHVICDGFRVLSQADFPKNTQFFPSCDDVFVAEQAWLKNHFLPLFSLDLGELNPEFSGHIVHVVNSLEPYDGEIGNTTKPFHNEFTKPNWFAFQIKENGKYEFLGNEGFFAYHHTKGQTSDTFEIAKDCYAKSKAHYLATGQVAYYNNYRQDFNVGWDFGNIGGYLKGDNWLDFPPSAFKIYGASMRYYDDNGVLQRYFEEVPEQLKPYANEHILITYNENPMFQVGWIGSFIPHTPETPIILYEPNNKIVLYTFQWT